MRIAIITIMSAILLFSVNNAQASSPPWGGDGHYTFGDEDDPFAESYIYDTATVDIIGGTFGSLHCFEYSAVYMSAGNGSWLHAYDWSSINLSGGSIDSIMAEDFSDVTFYVDNYHIEPTGGNGWVGTLTGSWLNNGGQFEIMLWDDSLSHINFVPEPATVILLGIGAVLFRTS